MSTRSSSDDLGDRPGPPGRIARSDEPAARGDRDLRHQRLAPAPHATGDPQCQASRSDLRRTLVVVLDFHEAAIAAEFLAAIPRDIHDDSDLDLLCVDSSGSVETRAAIERWLENRPARRCRALHLPPAGRGRDRKLAFRWAIDEGYGLVLTVAADGSVDPRALPTVLARCRPAGAGDVILVSAAPHDIGSRGAVAGASAMVSSWLRRVAGFAVPDLRAPVTAFSTALLDRIPFEVDRDDAGFDLEVLLQARVAGARTIELAAPGALMRARSSAALSTVRILSMLLHFRLHQWGMLCSLRYRHLAVGRYTDKTEMAYSSHFLALQVIERGPHRRLLDIGCGSGYVAAACRAKGIAFTGVDRDPRPPAAIGDYHQVDLEREALPVDCMDFDVVLLLDVLEHFSDPESFLLSLRNRSQAPPQRVDQVRFVITTPNVAFVAMRLNLALGRFSYAERGILDITHKRLFTRAALVDMLRSCGYVVERVLPIPVPFETVIGGAPGRLMTRLSRGLARLWPSLFAFQFMAICRPTPGVRQILAEASRGTAARAV